MRTCPHCGETMAKGQEICFACGQHLRERAHRRGPKPHNPLIFVFAGLLALAAIVGIIVMLAGRSSQATSEARRQERQRVEEAERAAVQAQRDSARAAVRDNATGMLVEEVNALEARFNLVRKQVVDSQPSPAQAKLISQISSEIAALRQLTAGVSDSAAGDSLREQLRDGQRVVRSLISALSRAPKR